MDLLTVIVASFAMWFVALVLVIIDSIRISNTQDALRKGLESFLTLAKDCEKMAEILEDHKEAIQDHCWALDVIYELFNLQKDINFRVRNSIELAQWQRSNSKWGEDRMASIIHATFRTEPDQAPTRPIRIKKSEKDKAEKSVKHCRKSTKNCVK